MAQISATAKICPLCHQDNGCQADTNPQTCWCHTLKVPQGLIDLVPEQSRRQACICRNCVVRYMNGDFPER